MLRRALEDHFAALICIYQGSIHERERNYIVFGPIKLLQQNILAAFLNFALEFAFNLFILIESVFGVPTFF